MRACADLVLELGNAGDLFQLLSRRGRGFPELQAAALFAQVRATQHNMTRVGHPLTCSFRMYFTHKCRALFCTNTHVHTHAVGIGPPTHPQLRCGAPRHQAGKHRLQPLTGRRTDFEGTETP